MEEEVIKSYESQEVSNNFSEDLPSELKLKLSLVETEVVEIEWKKGLVKGFLCSFPFLVLSIFLSWVLANNLTLLVKLSYLVTGFIFLITGTLTAFKSLRKRLK